jgi:hypothetical protein
MCPSASPLASREKGPPSWRSRQASSGLSEPGEVIDAIPSLADCRRKVAGSADKQGRFPRTESLPDARSLSGKQTTPSFRRSCSVSNQERLDTVCAAGPRGSPDTTTPCWVRRASRKLQLRCPRASQQMIDLPREVPLSASAAHPTDRNQTLSLCCTSAVRYRSRPFVTPSNLPKSLSKPDPLPSCRSPHRWVPSTVVKRCLSRKRSESSNRT